MPSEQSIQKAGITALEKRGAYCAKIVSASKAGVSDTLNCVPVVITEDMVGQTFGLFVAVEYKTPSGKVSPLQEYHLKKVRDAGGLGFVARSVDEVKQILGLE